jgi:ubiquinone/menaquinone biosynthesis C-methylase UbiE
MAKHGGYLGAVYEAKDAKSLALAYDQWATTYESEMAQSGYRHPSICVALLARHLVKGAAPLLDAGAGTGLLGEWLGIMGYLNVEALDLSEGMLAVARAKGSYTKLHRLALGSELPFADGHFAGVISSGVFTTGHVGPEGLDELVRITARGGVIVLTVKRSLWTESFRAHVDAMVLAGKVSIAEVTKPYLSMPGDPATTPSLGLVLRVF